MKTLLLIAVTLLTSLAWSQDIHHAPTAEQCHADIAVWKAEKKADIEALPINTLLDRANYLADCGKVLFDVKDRDEDEWTRTLRGVYDQHALHRTLAFIKRHDFESQFADEDAKGKR
jgi:hypothetical protein